MGKIIPVKGTRKVIAERMVESHLVSPDATHFVQVDMTNEQRFRKELSEKHGRKISANVIFAKIAAKTLSEFPYVNASYISGNNGSDDYIELHDEINIGIAVAVNSGVLVVNIRDCDKKSFVETADDFERLLDASKNNKLTIDDITGSTFVITSMAIARDVVFHIPIINQPNLAIMGVYRPQDTPVAVDGEIVIRPMMYLSLVTDHRVIDGVMTGEFIARLKYYLLHPEEIDNRM